LYRLIDVISHIKILKRNAMNKNQTTPIQKEKTSSLLSDPETLHKSVPQDKMKEPLSSSANSNKENIKVGNDNKREADKKFSSK
jgi:hypothetical protein